MTDLRKKTRFHLLTLTGNVLMKLSCMYSSVRPRKQPSSCGSCCSLFDDKFRSDSWLPRNPMRSGHFTIDRPLCITETKTTTVLFSFQFQLRTSENKWTTLPFTKERPLIGLHISGSRQIPMLTPSENRTVGQLAHSHLQLIETGFSSSSAHPVEKRNWRRWGDALRFTRAECCWHTGITWLDAQHSSHKM